MTLEIYEGINATQQYMKNAMVPEQNKLASSKMRKLKSLQAEKLTN